MVYSCNPICHLFAHSLSPLYHGLSVPQLQTQMGSLLIQTHYVSAVLESDSSLLFQQACRLNTCVMPCAVLNNVCIKGPMMKMIIKWLDYS